MARRKRSFWRRLLVGAVAAGARHSAKQARRAGDALKDRYGSQPVARASEDYGGKRKAGTPIANGGCPLNAGPFEPTPAWAFEAMVGNHHVPFSLVQDTSITALDSDDMITYALLACCRQVHTQRPIDECWPVTYIQATNEAAREHFGEQAQHLTPGMDRR